MNILQVCPHYLPATGFGGPLRVAHGLGQALIELDHSVTVCTTNLDTHDKDLAVDLDVPVLVDGVRVYYESTSLSRYWGYSPSLRRRVSKLTDWADVVLVHFHYQYANWVGARSARKHGKPHILFAHGSFNKWAISRKSRCLKNAYLNLLERVNIDQALFIVFNAPEEQQLSIYSDKGIVVPNGITPAEFVATTEAGNWRGRGPDLADKTIILYLGRLNPEQKGLDMLVPAFAKALQQRNNIHLLLVGPDERGGEAVIREMVSNLSIQDHVTFVGSVDGQEKLAILQDSDLFALVSPSEGTSIALLEALYMGLPAVVTNRIGLSDRIAAEETGIVVDRDINQIANAIAALADHPHERQLMGQRAHRLVADNFTWDKIAEQLVQAIKARTQL